MPITSDIAEDTYAERGRLAALLAGLSPEQWGRSTLCAGWRVREVVAHMSAPFHTSPLRIVTGIARAGFNYDRYAARAAPADTARLDDGELLAILQANLRTPWPRSAGGEVAGLSHDVIHGLDITEALGLDRVPPERVARVLAATTPRSLRYFGVDLGGQRLVATDADAAIGSSAGTVAGADAAIGAEGVVRLPAHQILLVITGRRALAEVIGS